MQIPSCLSTARWLAPEKAELEHHSSQDEQSRPFEIVSLLSKLRNTNFRLKGCWFWKNERLNCTNSLSWLPFWILMRFSMAGLPFSGFVFSPSSAVILALLFLHHVVHRDGKYPLLKCSGSQVAPFSDLVEQWMCLLSPNETVLQWRQSSAIEPRGPSHFDPLPFGY